MIDGDDVDTIWIFAMLTDNPFIGAILLVALVIYTAVYCSNEHDCGQRHCARGAPVLTHNDCMCMEQAK